MSNSRVWMERVYQASGFKPARSKGESIVKSRCSADSFAKDFGNAICLWSERSYAGSLFDDRSPDYSVPSLPPMVLAVLLAFECIIMLMYRNDEMLIEAEAIVHPLLNCLVDDHRNPQLQRRVQLLHAQLALHSRGLAKVILPKLVILMHQHGSVEKQCSAQKVRRFHKFPILIPEIQAIWDIIFMWPDLLAEDQDLLNDLASHLTQGDFCTFRIRIVWGLD